jgi:hypothetical protein
MVSDRRLLRDRREAHRLLADQNGVFLHDCNQTEDPSVIAAYAIDKENAERLWKMSEGIVGEIFEY